MYRPEVMLRRLGLAAHVPAGSGRYVAVLRGPSQR
jgi:hypothetical protein